MSCGRVDSTWFDHLSAVVVMSLMPWILVGTIAIPLERGAVLFDEQPEWLTATNVGWTCLVGWALTSWLWLELSGFWEKEDSECE